MAAGGVALVSSLVGTYFDRTPCRLVECCDKHSVSVDAKNVSTLANVFRKSVYGQHLMEDIVVRALRGHLLSRDPSKALVLSFHGPPGCGKSYVSEFIAQSLYAKGMKSHFARKFVGHEFPDPSLVNTYKKRVSEEVERVVKLCERALFIFEDIHKIPSGVLDALVPYIDHHTHYNGLDFRKAIFIFLSNTGADLISEKAYELWHQGKQREDITLHDFEHWIRQGSFNEEGGLQNSDTIRSSLIDHYIPFLPLLEEHVVKCIHDEFAKLGWPKAPSHHVEKILGEMTFIPEDVELFSTVGCKRVAAKVGAIADGQLYLSR